MRLFLETIGMFTDRIRYAYTNTDRNKIEHILNTIGRANGLDSIVNAIMVLIACRFRLSFVDLSLDVGTSLYTPISI